MWSSRNSSFASREYTQVAEKDPIKGTLLATNSKHKPVLYICWKLFLNFKYKGILIGSFGPWIQNLFYFSKKYTEIRKKIKLSSFELFLTRNGEISNKKLEERKELFIPHSLLTKPACPIILDCGKAQLMNYFYCIFVQLQ